MNYDGPSYYKKNTTGNEQPERPFFKKRRSENEAKKYQTPPPNYSRGKPRKNVEVTPRKDRYFRRKYIPDSLQKLDGWKKTEWNQELLQELEQRLAKTSEEYLLFGSDSTIPADVQREAKELSAQPSAPIKTETSKQEKIAEVHQQLKKDLNRPATGLHRSLSKIMAEDEEALKKGKNNLESLFT